MKRNFSYRFVFVLMSIGLLALFTACGTPTPSTPSASAAGSKSGQGTTTTSTTPVSNAKQPSTASATTPTSVAPNTVTTNTSCPASGSARAAVMTPMSLGNHQTIVYTYNTPAAGILRRYDVASGQKTNIVTLPNTTISDAQISANGQFILFVAQPASGPVAIQMVRLDGQELQTLYCSVNAQPMGIPGPYNLL